MYKISVYNGILARYTFYSDACPIIERDAAVWYIVGGKPCSFPLNEGESVFVYKEGKNK